MRRATRKLTARDKRFVDEYLIDLDPKRAALAAGYSPSMAASKAYQWVSNGKVKPQVFAAIQKAEAKRSERVQIDQDWVLRQWQAIADADPRELVQYLRGPCPDCWDEAGREAANPECRKCGGHGKGHVVLTDTRKLSARAAKLYAGVQLGKDGIKVNMRDQDAALANIARHLGMFKDSLELKGGINVTISQDDAAL